MHVLATTGVYCVRLLETVVNLGSANMLVFYAGLGREMAADYDHRSCILSAAGQV
jgi:hypothetical protein